MKGKRIKRKHDRSLLLFMLHSSFRLVIFPTSHNQIGYFTDVKNITL